MLKKTEEMKQAAEKLMETYQGSINEIRSGRKDVSFELNNQLASWYNNFIAICFSVGIGLIALLSTLTFSRPQLFFMWSALLVFIANGLFILLWRKSLYEKDMAEYTKMGYEEEYYLLVMKNRILDVLLDKPFNETEFTEAKQKLLSSATNGIHEAYEKTNRIDTVMDSIIAFFILGILLTGLGGITNGMYRLWAGIIFGLIYMGLLIFLWKTVPKAQNALDIRNAWEEKIQKERLRA